MPGTIVLLHGFAGTRHMWRPVAERLDAAGYTPLAVDLRGHGERARERPITFAACARDVLAVAPPRFALWGYSLGGRIALHVALAATERVTSLGLISTTAGLEDDGAREARRQSDEQLARELAALPIGEVARRWLSTPLFAGDPPSAAARQREDIERNDPAALAAVLRGVGAGEMEPLWPRLGELTMPAMAVAGARDARYAAIAQRLAGELGDGSSVVVPGVGHGLPREAPGALVRALIPEP